MLFWQKHNTMNLLFMLFFYFFFHPHIYYRAYKNEFEQAGMDIVGLSPDGNYVEVIEIKEHPYFLAVQYHPEFKSRQTKPHPLFTGWIKAVLKKRWT